MKFSGNVAGGTRKRWVDFGEVLDECFGCESQHELLGGLRPPSACSGIKLLMTTSEVAQGWFPSLMA